MSELITRAVNTYADNHIAALKRFGAAIRANDEAAMDIAFVLLREQIQTDFERYSIAVINSLQIIVSNQSERFDRLEDMVGAVAKRQEESAKEMHAALTGMSQQMAEEIRAALQLERVP